MRKFGAFDPGRTLARADRQAESSPERFAKSAAKSLSEESPRRSGHLAESWEAEGDAVRGAVYAGKVDEKHRFVVRGITAAAAKEGAAVEEGA